MTNLTITCGSFSQEREDIDAPKDISMVTDGAKSDGSKSNIRDSTTESVRVLTLENGQHQDTSIYRLEQGWYLEFRLGPSLFGRRIKIYVNIPKSGEKFARDDYKLLEWSNRSAADDSIYIRVKMTSAGSYHYYFTCDTSSQKCGSGFFIVDPIIYCGIEQLPLDCIQCVTFLTKNLGTFDTWENKLRVAKEGGYNAIHFTPIQELGESQSAYSLSDQLVVNRNFTYDVNKPVTINDVIALTEKMRNEWKMISICDIVLNHTANESKWLQKHPQCAYNLVNSPHLKPAYLLDITLHNLNMEISKDLWALNGVPHVINSEEHLSALRYLLLEKILPKVKIEELFIVPIEILVSEFLTKCRALPPPSSSLHDSIATRELEIQQDPLFRRLKSTIDMDLALKKFNIFRSDCFDEETRKQKCASEFKAVLETKNNDTINTVRTHLTAAVDNCIAGVRYFRVQSDGPKLAEISSRSPLFTRYFTDYNDEALENHMYTENAAFIMAHNGWVMNSDPLKNFAEHNSTVYLRRELIAWGDSVKLRYGESPEDCPYLWDRMRQYVQDTARAFDGVRLDNCHSTPIHVAEYLLDAARCVRPNLYVVAELFTNSDITDNLFVNRLGITSLIRESMSAWDSHELGRLVYRYGGDPVGAFIKPYLRPLVPAVAHALFLDLTHDNPSPIEKRSVFDLLPSSALVAMACCASGSSMGYDQLVPHHIHVVEETRSYMEWGTQVNENTGILAGKKALNDLHYFLGKNGYKQVFVDQIDKDIVCITRHNDITHESVILISYTAFHDPNPLASGEGKGVTVTGCVERIIIEAYLQCREGERYAKYTEFAKNEKFINGLENYVLRINRDFEPNSVTMVKLTETDENTTRVDFTNEFKPGCVVALKLKQCDSVAKALEKLSKLPDLTNIEKEPTLAALNKVLYCSSAEDDGVYTIPNFISFVYCGIQGILSCLDIVACNNDLGHPICDNLRNGNWLLDYTVKRLKNKTETKLFGEKLDEIFQHLKMVPRYLIPCYFYFVVSFVHRKMIELAWNSMSDTIKNGSEFIKLLALGSIQFGGIVDSSPLPPLSTNINAPVPAISETGMPLCVSLSAGLPHFAVGYMRNWGRDTFISLRGLFLLTGRFDEARYIILAYGGCLRHGLIPNLLDGGKNARYNCRDAVWWWLYTIKNYVSIAPNGINILDDKVNRLYPTDDSSLSSVDQCLYDVIQEVLQKHFQGLCFRERNAGSSIDAHMTSAGFDNQIGVHPVTGFVFGGNEWNCGTWMDKMGSSDKAGNRGKPATPRDGSAIEIVALCHAAVSWLAEVHKKKLYPYSGVTRRGKDDVDTSWTFAEWRDKIHANFEKHFWIPTTASSDELRPDLVNRRGIYKDCFGSSQPWTDYQLRCNYCVAMVVSPDLFSPDRAWMAVEKAKSLLLGPLGMKTLDPTDWVYCGYYDNSDDSSNSRTAQGYNYHQGPEWLWPVGYLLRARLHYAKILDGGKSYGEIVAECKSYLANHYIHLKQSDWRGLPELTNKDGAFCPFSCSTQAWSMASILEAIYEIENIENGD